MERSIILKNLLESGKLVSGSEPKIDMFNTLYSPKEMLAMGVFGMKHEISNEINYDNNYFGVPSAISKDYDNFDVFNDFFINYNNICNGIHTEFDVYRIVMRHKRLLIQALTMYKEQLLNEYTDDALLSSYKQLILELGWNYEVDYFDNAGIESIEIEPKYVVFDLRLSESSDLGDDDIVYEASKSNNKVPVLILLSSGYSIFSAGIKAVTSSLYSHASISFDINLDSIYSFDPTGFANESRATYYKGNKDALVSLYTIIVDKTDADTMQLKLNEIIRNQAKFKYNFAGIFGVLSGQPISVDNRLFCSEFVDSLLKLVDIDVTGKHSGLVAPADFERSKSSNIYKLYEGVMSKYDSKRARRTINKLLIKYINEGTLLLETKSFPVGFDDAGNLIIKNMKKLNFEEEYYSSHKLLELYKKSDNIEGAKYEISKLWFLNAILEKEIYSPTIEEDRRKYCLKIRAKILNDFNNNLKFIISKDKSFNFVKYYDETPFSDASYKISNHDIKFTIELIKQIARL